jgi:hypothetical protein
MTKSVISISFALLASMSITAHGQRNPVESPVVGAPVHPGTAILDSMNIFAGVPTPMGGSVHPGTVLLDSLGIFAGEPAATVPVIADKTQGAVSAVILR